MTNKMTKKEMWAKILSFKEVQADPELVAGIEHEIELLDRKNASKKPTVDQLLAKELSEKALEVLNAEGMTATEVATAIQPYFPDKTLTAARLTNVLYNLVNTRDDVEQFTFKRKSLFKKVEG